MAQIGLARYVPTMLLLVIFVADFAVAQRSQPPNTPDITEYRNQRWLPLPPGRSEAMSEFERQLRNPSGAKNERAPSHSSGPSFPKLDAKDIEQLKDLIKQYSDQLPPDFVPPDMDGISSESISRALQDPEVLAKAKKLVEQYQKNKQLRNRTQSRPTQSDDPSGMDGEPGAKESDAAQTSAEETPRDPAGLPPGRNANKNSVRPSGQPKGPRGQSNNSEDATSKSDPDDAQRAEDTLFNPTGVSSQPSSESNKTSPPQREMLQGVEELLKQINQSEATRSTGDSKNAANSGGRGQSDAANRPNASQANNEEIRRQLEKKGFGETLRSLVEEARKTAEQQSGSPSTEQQNRDSQTRNIRGNASANSSQSTTQANKDSKSSSENAKNANGTSEWGTWFSKVLQDINESVNENTPVGNSSTSGSDSAPAPEWPEQNWAPPVNGFANLWMVIAIIGLIAMMVVLLYSKQIKERVVSVIETQRSKQDFLKAPGLIQNRADVIRAFHQLAYRIAAPVEDWWTHRSITRQACRNAPALQSPVEVAARIYELARYQPLGVELSDEQLESVRKAMQDCEANRKA